MRVINALEEYEKQPYEIACFMAGGCGHIEWQEKFLDTLKQYNPISLVVYNPYNPNIESTFQQIRWEHKYLTRYIDDKYIFSVYFDKYTRQPMSMFELGVMSILSQDNSFKVTTKRGETTIYDNYGFPCVVSVHPEAPGLEDIKCQMGLYKMPFAIRTPEEHAIRVLQVYREIKSQQF